MATSTTSAERPSTASAAAKVFSIYELTEQILCYANMPTIVNFARVSAHTRSVISSSPSLRAKLYSVGPFGISSPPNTNVISIVPRNIMALNQYNEIVVNVSHRQGEVEPIPVGSRGGWWGLQVSKPVTRRFEAMVMCGEGPGDLVVESQEGVTLGMAYDATEKAAARHKKCVMCRARGYLCAIFAPGQFT